MKKRTKIMVAVLVLLLGSLSIGAAQCKKQDVITTLEITQSTLDVLYNGTVVILINQYCSTQTEAMEDYKICQEFKTVIDPSVKEFLSTTFPSLIRIAKIAIPEGTEVKTTELSLEQQVKIRKNILW